MGAQDVGRARAYVAAQVAALRALEPAAAAGDEDAVHDARTATRRLRTALAVCEPALGRRRVREARAGLRDLGHALGAVRDPGVELAWLRATLDGLPPGLVGQPVPARLTADRGAVRHAALVRLRQELASPAHGQAMAAVDRLVGGRWRSSGRPVRRRARREWRRLDRALTAARRVPPGPARDEALHLARRQARRARYAAEVVGTRRALASAARATAVQDALGAQHDAALVRDAIADAAERAASAGEPVSAYGLLHALAQEEADRAERAARPAARRARKRGHRRWTR